MYAIESPTKQDPDWWTGCPGGQPRDLAREEPKAGGPVDERHACCGRWLQQGGHQHNRGDEASLDPHFPRAP